MRWPWVRRAALERTQRHLLTLRAELARLRGEWRSFIDPEWIPTAAFVNALPERVRKYVHDLETRADPAGDVRTAWVAKDAVESLSIELKEARSLQVSGFYEERYPQYSQGAPNHELEDTATAEECNGMVRRIRDLEDVVDWIVSDGSYKAPEQVGEVAAIWLARLRAVVKPPMRTAMFSNGMEAKEPEDDGGIGLADAIAKRRLDEMQTPAFKACLAMADDGWLMHGVEGYSKPQQMVLDVIQPELDRRARASAGLTDKPL